MRQMCLFDFKKIIQNYLSFNIILPVSHEDDEESSKEIYIFRLMSKGWRKKERKNIPQCNSSSFFIIYEIKHTHTI